MLYRLASDYVFVPDVNRCSFTTPTIFSCCALSFCRFIECKLVGDRIVTYVRSSPEKVILLSRYFVLISSLIEPPTRSLFLFAKLFNSHEQSIVCQHTLTLAKVFECSVSSVLCETFWNKANVVTRLAWMIVSVFEIDVKITFTGYDFNDSSER